MSHRLAHILKLAATALAICAGSSSFAGDPVNDAIQEAYAPYREALFQTNSKNQAGSQSSINRASQAWSGIVSRFAAKVPPPYDRDASFPGSLAAVADVYAQASAEINANKLTEAHETLERVRDIIAEARHRNGVIVYSDHMNAYHLAMESVLIDGSKVLLQANGLQQVADMVAVLRYLNKKLSTEAPANLSNSVEFVALVKDVDKSVIDLHTAVASQDVNAVKLAISKIKSPYSKLFLKFG